MRANSPSWAGTRLLKKIDVKRIFDEMYYIIEYVTLVQLMDSLGNVNHVIRRVPAQDGVRSHSLVCSKNYLLIVGIGPIINKDLEFIFGLIALIVRAFIVLIPNYKRTYDQSDQIEK